MGGIIYTDGDHAPATGRSLGRLDPSPALGIVALLGAGGGENGAIAHRHAAPAIQMNMSRPTSIRSFMFLRPRYFRRILRVVTVTRGRGVFSR